MRILDKETRSLMLELHRIGGRVVDGDAEPVANAWVVLSGAGWTATDDEGRFFFQNIPPGTYECTARGPDGTEASTSIEVPGGMLDLTLGTASRKPAKRRS
jgi:protocatechuate 3,4-dioxygenase beta subunit